jgi:hypothetical protein
MAHNTQLLRYKTIINEWHLKLLAYDDVEQQAGVPTTRPPFSLYPGTFYHKENENEGDNQLNNVWQQIKSDCQVQKQTETF